MAKIVQVIDTPVRYSRFQVVAYGNYGIERNFLHILDGKTQKKYIITEIDRKEFDTIVFGRMIYEDAFMLAYMRNLKGFLDE